MTKNELVAILQSVEGNPKIILATDEEGNSFNEVYEAVYQSEPDEDDDDSSLVLEFGGPVIVLWP